ncbi:alpha/beta fold hydrolase [Polymorphum gilvum]|uniref:Hydrolase, alpha/beta fold family, putative n=1 Tax=Polymorphum gilvum (strain LMG 25793 / CGMCC 1.9160 / SL003B-26A1) TaxID=991905 RepID=F2J122_POLGS|nr:alpha/beta hydrolase [Polymorphum gilvum]ADZ71968.1 Hydrolase, alpha/beta fold family, putative [Polymorphum gilvum SL003B-26A1]
MPDGLFLHEAGSGTPLLLLHGWSCHGGFFAPQVEALAERALVLAPDLPGHGRTGGAFAPTIEVAADAAAALLAERDLSGVVVCGWSMGAHVAYALAQRHGTARIKALIAIDMTPKVLNDADWRLGSRDGLDAERNADVLARLVPSWPAPATRIAERIFATDRTPDAALLDFARREIAASDPVLLAAMWASLTGQDFRAVLPRLEVPLHLAMGDHSALYGPEVADWYRRMVPTARLHRFAASGHAPHLEEADRFNALLGTLLAG